MSGLKIEWEWESPGKAAGAELRATWARLAISVDGHCITSVSDRDTKSVRSAVYVPLYPLAEWIAANWWSLCYEPVSPARPEGYGLRHSFGAAREGYALPSLQLEPMGDLTALTWHRWSPASGRVEFFGGGHAILPSDDVRQELRRFVDAVTRRLAEESMHDTFLQQEWTAISNADAEETEFCIASGSLGLDPYDLDAKMQKIILAVSNMLPAPLFFELCEASAVTSLSEEATQVARGMARLGGLKGFSLQDFGKFPERSAAQPWQMGYDVARKLRTRLGLGDRTFPTLPDLLERLGLKPGPQQAIVFERKAGPSVVNGLVDKDDTGKKLAVFANIDPTKKFSLSRALFRAWSLENSGARLVTDSVTNEQKASRAFAAEFLAPIALLRKRVRSAVLDQDAIEELAQEFGVSPFVIRHQAVNNNLAFAGAW